ncbi:MAG: hypothetical protein ACXVPW_18210 [Bacteroidia bacterium]
MPYNFDNNDLRQIYLAISGGSGGGDASAANQTIQIDQLLDGSLQPSSLKDVSDDISWLSKIKDALYYAGNSYFKNSSNGANLIKEIGSNTNELIIHNYYGIATPAILVDATFTGLLTQFIAFIATNANKFEMNKQIVWDGTNFNMFITYSTN